MSSDNYAFSSADVSGLVGITPVYLNALVTRRLYGVAPSISERHGEMKLRIFSEEDVLGIALIWMLFETGLRTQSVKQILLQLVETDEPDASAAADFIKQSEISHLVILRARTKSKKKPNPWLKVEPTSEENLTGLLVESVSEHPRASLLVVPVGIVFADLGHHIKLMYEE